MSSAKAWIAAVLAALSTVAAQGADVLPAWALLLVAAAIAGLATYVVPNRPTPRHRDRAD